MTKNKPYFKLILLSVLLTLTVTAFSAVPVITKADMNGTLLYQITAFLLTSLFFTFYMKKQDASLKSFGFSFKKVQLWLLILLGIIILIQPLILGIDETLQLSTLSLIVIQMVLVGYTEEVLFRSIFFYHLKTKKKLTYVLFSAFVFGILHSISAINPAASFLLVSLQVINALLLGILFASIYFFTKNIYLLILAHALFNIFATLTKPASIETTICSVMILVIIYIIALFLLYILRNNQTESTSK